VGAGFAFQSRETFAKYYPEFLIRYPGKLWNTHSIYFSMLASHGFPGLALFVGMFLFCFMSCRKMRKQIQGRPELSWIGSYTGIVIVSLIAFLVNGAFVNMEYFDLPYHLVAIVAGLKVICSRALAASDGKDAAALAA
jgi:O-antigen ligase